MSDVDESEKQLSEECQASCSNSQLMLRDGSAVIFSVRTEEDPFCCCSRDWVGGRFWRWWWWRWWLWHWTSFTSFLWMTFSAATEKNSLHRTLWGSSVNKCSGFRRSLHLGPYCYDATRTMAIDIESRTELSNNAEWQSPKDEFCFVWHVTFSMLFWLCVILVSQF